MAIQSEEGDALLAGIDADRRLESWHLVAPSGDVASAGAAAAPLAELLPGGRPLAWAFRRAPRTTDSAYRWVARNRGRFARALGIEDSCELRRG